MTPYMSRIPSLDIDVVEGGRRPRRGREAFDLAKDLEFSTEDLESFAFAKWEPLICDAMVVAAAIEFGDRRLMRPTLGWARKISLRIPVCDPARWASSSVLLHDAICFLTGDHWDINFVQRIGTPEAPSQTHFPFSSGSQAVLAYSDGMDSRAASGIVESELGQNLVRIRLGTNKNRKRVKVGKPLQAFTAIPYNVHIQRKTKEPTARNRGFKFAMISAIAAYLTDARKIVIPESGQGALGPVLVTVGHAYPDYRNHPLFTSRMSRFVGALFRHSIDYVFPRIWNTKGETLRDFVTLTNDDKWRGTKSCWRDNRWSASGGQYLQCGVCAACMLRRLSVHAAGLNEDPKTYICSDLSSATLDDAVIPGFTKLGRAFEEYAIAGVLHLDHLAEMAKGALAKRQVLEHAELMAPALGLTSEDVANKLTALLDRHASEWMNYINALGPNSFIRNWVQIEQ